MRGHKKREAGEEGGGGVKIRKAGNSPVTYLTYLRDSSHPSTRVVRSVGKLGNERLTQPTGQ